MDELDKKLIGPPLEGISEKRSREWLQSWIRDNNALRASGDQDAIAIFEEYNKITNFFSLVTQLMTWLITFLSKYNT